MGTQNFRKPVNARYVRLVVQTWSHHISMRSALKIGKGCTGRRRSRALRCSGSRNYIPSYSECKASSIWGNDKMGHRHGSGNLNSGQGWSAKHNKRGQWWQIDARSVKPITGVRTQRRRNNAQRVTGYKVKVSKNGRHWKWVDGGRVFRGNRANNEAVVTQNFRKPVNARYVRLVVQTWSHHISMRSALKIGKGCTGRRRSRALRCSGSRNYVPSYSKCKASSIW